MKHEEPEKSTGELRIELRHVREAVGAVLDDYRATAETLDSVTAAVDGIESTDHADNVERLRDDLLDALESDGIKPPWVRDGYETQAEWRADR